MSNALQNHELIPPLTQPPLQNPNEYNSAPEDAMQVDLVPGIPPSGGYENIVTASEVFSRYLFAYPTSNQDAKTVAKVITSWLSTPTYRRHVSQIKVQLLHHM